MLPMNGRRAPPVPRALQAAIWLHWRPVSATLKGHSRTGLVKLHDAFCFRTVEVAG